MLEMVKAKLSLVNWQFQLYRIILILAIFGGWSYFMWDNGKDHGYQQCSNETIAGVVATVEERMPVINAGERGAAQLEQELKLIKERLDEATNTRSYGAECDLSPEQLRLYKGLSEKTKR